MTSGIKYLVFLVSFSLFNWSSAQGGFNLRGETSEKIYFQLINNLIVLPVEVNGIELSFVLDTGVSKPILFNLLNLDSLKIKRTETIALRGLGRDGSIEALKSKRNFLKVGSAINVNQNIFIVFDPSINFSSRLGVPIHGIIGYDLFRNFIVEINYSNKFIRLHKRLKNKKRLEKKWNVSPITFYKNKPYINAEIEDQGNIHKVKLLIDSGGSDALWLFEDKSLGIVPNPNKVFQDFLGKGLSGSVYGKRSKLEKLTLGEYHLKSLNVAYPDSLDLNIAKMNTWRNGSLAGNVLRRFNWFFDYKGNKVYYKKNGSFNKRFYYNNAGITLEHSGMMIVQEKVKPKATTYEGVQTDNAIVVEGIYKYQFISTPAYEIVELRTNSNAVEAGLRLGDIILAINGKSVQNLTLNQINKFFYSDVGRLISIKVDRKGEAMNFKFRLDDVFKKKSPQIEGSSESFSKM